MISKSNYIMTYSGIKVDPLNIQQKDVHIKDIAHSLSMSARANGHFKSFYSVAQHSINCAIEAKNRGFSKRVQLACLLHDAAEAYIADVPRPVKHRLVGYEKIEQHISDVIFSVFGLSDLSRGEYDNVKQIDDAILYYEFDTFMDIRLTKVKPYISTSHDFSCKSIENTYNNFIALFKYLSDLNETVVQNRSNKVIGVDGCRGGWMAFIIDNDHHTIKVYKSIEALCIENSDAELIIVDMPIGLPESIYDIRPDSYARKILKGRAACIFNCPCRQAIYEKSYEQANKTNKEILGKGLSKQSYAISSKIKEIDMFLRKNESYRNRLVEGHPEVCFAMLNGKPILEKKTTAAGIENRLNLLSKFHEGLHEAITSTQFVKTVAQTDDIVDAMCMAIVAKLGHKLQTIPKKPQKDSKGLLMQMVYVNGV